ncbi:MAG: SIR2 family NAD-dependent protein deacylase [Crocinitomicaceae bacterium]
MKKKLVVFSGAGMSAESGISTFRDSGGLWEKYKIEEVATPEAWRRNPDLVTDFYNQRRKQILESAPNLAHIQLVKWEESFETIVITQNIDDLHERAGSHNVLHLHGNIRMAKSSGPNQEKKYYPVNGWELKISDVCDDGYRLRPHVVWFGEDVPGYQQAAEIIASADVLLVIGTSLQVYPAAGLIHEASSNCRKIIVDPHVNEFKIPSFFEQYQGSAVEVLPGLNLT